MNLVTITSTIHAPINKVWGYWTGAEHIKKWNFASSDWHCPKAENHLIVGGEFHYIMSAKDNSMSFDFWGTYQTIESEKLIEILLGDGRKMSVLFEETENGTLITEKFEPETENTVALQQMGWQMILDNFKSYTEI